MSNKIILATSHLDKHRMMISKEALLKAAASINNGEKLRWTINHKRELPPLGKIDYANVIEKDGEFFLTGDALRYPKKEKIDWDNSLTKEYFDEGFKFAEIESKPLEKFQVSLDVVNFSTIEEFERLNKEIYELSNGDVELQMHGRKSEFPDPEIIFKISRTVILFLLFKPFVEKIGEKLADDFYDETKKQLKIFRGYLVKVIKKTRAISLPKKRKLITIIEIPGKPHIELYARTDDPELISIGLSEKNITFVKKEITKLNHHFDIAKIQFILNESGHWKFNYLLTGEGATIGKSSSFKERDRQYQRLTLGKYNVS